mmetsp:Transcript_47604/g.157776  ORF Transcript_47604/g.157776 Transcript_47604/m.157776 type:complete len:200 (+) Transcript_47604:678-1277(+)
MVPRRPAPPAARRQAAAGGGARHGAAALPRRLHRGAARHQGLWRDRLVRARPPVWRRSDVVCRGGDPPRREADRGVEAGCKDPAGGAAAGAGLGGVGPLASRHALLVAAAARGAVPRPARGDGRRRGGWRSRGGRSGGSRGGGRSAASTVGPKARSRGREREQHCAHDRRRLPSRSEGEEQRCGGGWRRSGAGSACRGR